jgi:glycosyltransferase involved in cell wall biosynthesis
MPKITFFMLAYNSEKTVKKAVESILKQSENDINLFVRNNGSTDRTGEILQEEARKDSRLHVVFNEENWKDKNGVLFTYDGVIRIWPIENKELLGEYISIVDSDDWIDEKFSEKMYNAAKKIDADITVSGSTFFENGTVKTGIRLPPEAEAKSKNEIENLVKKDYLKIHNSFRTWWGKLFKKEFFLEHYDSAWKAVGGGNGNVLDTVIMLRYLEEANSLSCVAEPLYQFRKSDKSTYKSRRKAANIRALEVDTLYLTSVEFLKNFNAVNRQNTGYLISLHWMYISETLDCLKTVHPDFSVEEELSGVASLLSSSAFGSYYSNSIEVIYPKIIESLKLIYERNKGNFNIYESYLMRLLYLQKKVDAGEKNLLFYQILVGCLYDFENKNKIGFHLIGDLAAPQIRGKNNSLLIYQMQEMYMNPSYPAFFSNSEERKKETASMENELKDAFNNNDFSKVGTLFEKIIAINPMNRTALYYFMKMLLLSEQNREFCAVLAGTCKSLWQADCKMQSLCWSILSSAKKEN